MKGQSAIEYLTTYGWMLLVIAVVGGSIFTTVRNSSQVQSTSGLANADVQIEDFGVSENNGLEMKLRGAAGNQLENVELNISDPETGETVSTPEDVTIPVGDTKTVTLNNVSSGESTNTYDVEIEYDEGGLEGLTVEGSLTGSLRLTGKSPDLTSPTSLTATE